SSTSLLRHVVTMGLPSAKGAFAQGGGAHCRHLQTECEFLNPAINELKTSSVLKLGLALSSEAPNVLSGSWGCTTFSGSRPRTHWVAPRSTDMRTWRWPELRLSRQRL